MEDKYVTVGLALFMLLMTVVGWLIVNKVDRLEADIKQSKEDHIADATELTVLKLKVAEHYPSKMDMKEMFEQFKSYLDERFTVVENIAKYSNRRQTAKELNNES